MPNTLKGAGEEDQLISPRTITATANRTAVQVTVSTGATPSSSLPADAQRHPTARARLTQLTLALYVLVLFAWLWPHDRDATSSVYLLVSWAAFMLRTFLLPIGVVVGLLALVALRRRLRGPALALGLLLLPTIGSEARHFSAGAAAPRLPGDALTLMTVNLWEYNASPRRLAESMLAADAEVLLIQEFTPAWQRVILETLGDRYPHRAWTKRCDAFGMAVLSKRPFVEPVRSDFTPGSHDIPQMRAVVEVDARRVVIYNIHLAPPRRLSFFATQNRQFAALLDLFARENDPLIVGGDWNFSDIADHAFRMKSAGFTDAWAQAGAGRGATWPGDCGWFRRLAGLRIDHIFLNGGLVCAEVRTTEACGSDHVPMIARIGFAKESSARRRTGPPYDDSRIAIDRRSLTLAQSITFQKAVTYAARLF